MLQNLWVFTWVMWVFTWVMLIVMIKTGRSKVLMIGSVWSGSFVTADISHCLTHSLTDISHSLDTRRANSVGNRPTLCYILLSKSEFPSYNSLRIEAFERFWMKIISVMIN